MKTLYATLKKTTHRLDLSDSVLKDFSKEFNLQYEDFLSDFVFSATNNTYSVYNGLFITKIKKYFKELFDKYRFTDNKLLLSTAFTYQFFLELEGIHSSHSYRVMSPFTLEELLDVSNREKYINLTNLKFSYKNIKDIGNAALFITLAIINSDFDIKLKEIDSCVTKNTLNFMFSKNCITNTISNDVGDTIENVLVEDILITSENLALIQFMQVFVLEDTHTALCSVRKNPNTISGYSSVPSTLRSSYSAKQQLLNNDTSINLIFPEVINNRVSLFNVILGNSQGLLENLHKRNLSSPTTLHLLEITFIEVLNRFTNTLLNPTDNISEILNMFYTKVVGTANDTAFYVCSHPSSFFHINLSGLTEMRDQLLGYNNYVVDGEITQYGLTDIVENMLSVNIISDIYKDFDFSESLLNDEIEDALNKVLEVYDTYSKFSKQLNIFSVEMLKFESTIKSYGSKQNPPILTLLENKAFLNNYFSVPFFIMNALTPISFLSNDSLASGSVHSDSFFTKYSKHLEKDITKEKFSFFLNGDSFDQVEYLNVLLALEIKSQILLLQQFPQYYFIYGDMIKFRVVLKSGQNSSYGNTPKFSFFVPAICKLIPSSLHSYISNTNEISDVFPIFALNSTRGVDQGLDTFMCKEYLLRKHAPNFLEEFPQFNIFFTLVYRLIIISKLIFRVFNMYERNSEKIFDARLAAMIRDEILLFKNVNAALTSQLERVTFYTYNNSETVNRTYCIDPESKCTISENQEVLINKIKAIDETLTQEDVLDVLVEYGLPAEAVSPFNEKITEIVLQGSQQFTTDVTTSFNSFSILDNVLHLLSCDASKTENIYEEKIKSIMNGNNIIRNHAKTLALKEY